MHWLHFGAREQMHAGKPSGGDTANGSHKESTKGFGAGGDPTKPGNQNSLLLKKFTQSAV